MCSQLKVTLAIAATLLLLSYCCPCNASVGCEVVADHGSVRLVGGASELEGRVERCSVTGWISVCRRNVTQQQDEADLICKQSGFSVSNGSAWILEGIPFGEGKETQSSNCNGSNTLALRCKPLLCQDWDVRLVGGGGGEGGAMEGRVEVCKDEQWFGVYGCPLWSSAVSNVVCRQLGFSQFGAQVVSVELSTEGRTPMKLEVNCTGEQMQLRDCNITVRDGLCQNTAAVQCQEKCAYCQRGGILDVTVDSTRRTSIHLSWIPRLPVAHSVLQYNISCSADAVGSSGNVLLSQTVSNSSSAVTMSGLAPSTDYECCVSVVREFDHPATCVTASTMEGGLTPELAGFVGGLLGVVITLLVLLGVAAATIFVLRNRGKRKTVLRSIAKQRKFPSAEVLAELNSEQNKVKYKSSTINIRDTSETPQQHFQHEPTTEASSSDNEAEMVELALGEFDSIDILTAQCVAYYPIPPSVERKPMPYEDIGDIPTVPHEYEDVETRPKAHTYEAVEETPTAGAFSMHSYVDTEIQHVTHVYDDIIEAKPKANAYEEVEDAPQMPAKPHTYNDTSTSAPETRTKPHPYEDWDDNKPQQQAHSLSTTPVRPVEPNTAKPSKPKKPGTLRIKKL